MGGEVRGSRVCAAPKEGQRVECVAKDIQPTFVQPPFHSPGFRRRRRYRRCRHYRRYRLGPDLKTVRCIM